MTQVTAANPSTPSSSPALKRGGVRVWAFRAIGGLCLSWSLLHVLGVGLSPGREGQLPTWATPEQWLGATAASGARYLSLLCLAVFFGWWVKRPSHPSSVGKLARVSGAGCAGFALLHVWHLRAYLSASSAANSAADRGYALADHLAATLSATHWGIPWLALGYLIGSISVGLLLGCELWLATQRADAPAGWRRQRSYAWLSLIAGLCVSALMLRALLYFATGSASIS